MAQPRKPMTFDIDRSPPTEAEQQTVRREPARPKDDTARKQVGARISAATYRQLKARAALNDVPVQELVERAIEEFLAKAEK